MIRCLFVLEPLRLRGSVLFAAVAPLLASCAFLIDFDELQGGSADGGASGGAGAAPAGGGGAGAAPAGGAGSGGTAGMSGGGGGTGGTGASDASTGGVTQLPDADAAPGIALGELPTMLADAACSALERCAGSAMELVVGAEECQTLFIATLQDGYAAAIDASIKSGRLTYDPVEAEACAGRLIDAALQDPPQCSAFNAIIEECKSALGGLAQAGGECLHSFECAKSLTCDVSSACPGTCVPLGATGAPCLVDAECDPTLNLYCRTGQGPDAGASGTCTEFVALGAPCDVNTEQCELGGLCVDGTCRRIADVFTAAEGFPCYTTGSLCTPDLSCEFNALPFLSQGTCVAEKAPLEACGIALPDECSDGHYCSAGQCLALPSLNQPCATSFLANVGLVPRCAAGFACVAGICKAKARLGDACEADVQCYGAACVSGQCIAPSCG